MKQKFPFMKLWYELRIEVIVHLDEQSIDSLSKVSKELFMYFRENKTNILHRFLNFHYPNVPFDTKQLYSIYKMHFDGWLPHYALTSNNLPLVICLDQKKCYEPFSASYWTEIWTRGHVEIIEHFLERIKLIELGCYNLVYHSVLQQNIVLLQWLLENHRDVFAEEYTDRIYFEIFIDMKIILHHEEDNKTLLIAFLVMNDLVTPAGVAKYQLEYYAQDPIDGLEDDQLEDDPDILEEFTNMHKKTFAGIKRSVQDKVNETIR